MTTIYRNTPPPVGKLHLPVPFAKEHEPTDAEIEQGYRQVRNGASTAWVWNRTVCYEVIDRNAAPIKRWALEED